MPHGEVRGALLHYQPVLFVALLQSFILLP
jgi:hypothetical protein